MDTGRLESISLSPLMIGFSGSIENAVFIEAITKRMSQKKKELVVPKVVMAYNDWSNVFCLSKEQVKNAKRYFSALDVLDTDKTILCDIYSINESSLAELVNKYKIYTNECTSKRVKRLDCLSAVRASIILVDKKPCTTSSVLRLGDNPIHHTNDSKLSWGALGMMDVLLGRHLKEDSFSFAEVRGYSSSSTEDTLLIVQELIDRNYLRQCKK